MHSQGTVSCLYENIRMSMGKCWGSAVDCSWLLDFKSFFFFRNLKVMHIFGSRVDFVRRRADNNKGISGLHAGTCYQSASFINYDLNSLVINVPHMQVVKVWKQVKMFWLIKEQMECLKKKKRIRRRGTSLNGAHMCGWQGFTTQYWFLQPH